WEAATGRELLTFKGQSFRSVAFSADNLRIVTGGWAGSAMVWNAAPAGQVAAWQAEERMPAPSLSAPQTSTPADPEHQKTVADLTSQNGEPVRTEAMLREALRLARLTETTDVSRVAIKILDLTYQLTKPDQRVEHDA